MRKYLLIFVLLLFLLWLVYCSRCFLPHKELPHKKKKQILCLGDSITFGAGVSFMRWRDSYPAILGRLLGKEYHIMNYGISGSTLQYSGDKPYAQSFMNAAKQTGADMCLVMLGTNDSKPHNWNEAQFRSDLAKRVEEIRAFPKTPEIILVLPPSAFGHPVPFEIRNEIISDKICPCIRQYADENGIKVIDLNSLTEPHPEWFADGVHPNREGNEAIARLVAAFVSDKT